MINQQKKKASALYIGNLLDHYDGALFAFLSPIFATQFFPQTDYLSALILTYAMLPMGVITKVIGALYYGSMGDQQGPTKALCHTLFGISFLSFCMAFLPSYEAIGVYAPLALLGLRLVYNFFSAAESVGGAIAFIGLSKKESEKDLLSSVFSTSSIGGILMASTLISLFYFFDLMENHWRALYLVGGAAGFVGYFLRRQENIVLSDDSILQSKTKMTLKEIWGSMDILLTMTLASAYSYACYAMAFVLMNAVIPLVTSYSYADVAMVNTSLLVLDFLLLPFFGYLATKIGRLNVMIGSMSVAIFSACILFPLLSSASLFILMMIRIIIVGVGVAFCATYNSWALSIAPPNYRYSSIATTYALGSRLVGSSTAAISLYLFQKTDSLFTLGLYWLLLAIGTGGMMLRITKRPYYIEVT